MREWFGNLYRPKQLTILLFGLQLSLGALDLLTMPATDIAQFYVIIILLSFFAESPRLPYILALCATTLSVIDFILPPHDTHSPPYVALARRTFGIINFWAVAFVTSRLVQYKKSRDVLLKSLEMQKVKVQQSNEELENFASIAAHDLSSPLKSMIGWSDLLEESEKNTLNSTTKEAIHFIKASAMRCSKLVEELLEMARVNTNAKTESVPLNALVRSVITTLQPEIDAAGANIISGELPTVQGNPSHLVSMFSNLIRNALTYRDTSRTTHIELGCRETESSYEIFVKDNGIGIEAVQKAAIFEMFKRLHSDRPGTGIGLALCKKIVTLMGGSIWVESMVKQGSTFYIRLPKET